MLTKNNVALLGMGTILAREAIREDARYWGQTEAYVRLVWAMGLSMREDRAQKEGKL